MRRLSLHHVARVVSVLCAVTACGEAAAQERFTGSSSKYADAVRVGDLVFLSGIVSPDPDPSTQFRCVFERIEEVLEDAGSGLDRVVELTTYHIDLHEHIDDFVSVKDEFLPDLPVWTAVGVTELYSPGAYVEVKVVAAVDPGGR